MTLIQLSVKSCLTSFSYSQLQLVNSVTEEEGQARDWANIISAIRYHVKPWAITLELYSRPESMMNELERIITFWISYTVTKPGITMQALFWTEEGATNVEDRSVNKLLRILKLLNCPPSSLPSIISPLWFPDYKNIQIQATSRHGAWSILLTLWCVPLQELCYLFI